MIYDLPLDGGKYVIHYDHGVVTASRNGEPWRDLAGDKLVLALLELISTMEHKLIDKKLGLKKKNKKITC